MKNTLLAASCSFALNPAAEQKLVLIPDGIFKGVDGRPFDAPHWNLTPENGQALANALNQRQIDMLIDYEHGIIAAKQNGTEAPASGWLKAGGFEYVKGVGLCSNNWKWTEKAASYIAKEEYKYLSPFILYDEQGFVYGLINVALTNVPNLDTLPPALLAAAAQDFLSQNYLFQNNEDSIMNEFLKLMCKKLGLSESATEQELLTAANSQFAQIDAAYGTSMVTDQTMQQALEKAVELKVAANSQATPDPSKFVPIAMYNEAKAQAAEVASKGQTKEIDDLISAACSDGRLTGKAAIDWAKDFAERDFAGFKTHIDAIPKIAALTQRQTEQLKGSQQDKPQPVDDITASIASQFGLGPATFGA